MNQDRFDNIVNILIQYGSDDDVEAFKKLWRKYQQLNGAMMFNQNPEIHIHYDAKDSDVQ